MQSQDVKAKLVPPSGDGEIGGKVAASGLERMALNQTDAKRLSDLLAKS